MVERRSRPKQRDCRWLDQCDSKRCQVARATSGSRADPRRTTRTVSGTRSTRERALRALRSLQTSRKQTTSDLEKRQPDRRTWRFTQRHKLRGCVASSVRSMRDKRGCASTTISISGDVQVKLRSPATRASSGVSTSAPTVAASSTVTDSNLQLQLKGGKDENNT